MCAISVYLDSWFRGNTTRRCGRTGCVECGCGEHLLCMYRLSSSLSFTPSSGTVAASYDCFSEYPGSRVMEASALQDFFG
jgi:hypothetical protein